MYLCLTPQHFDRTRHNQSHLQSAVLGKHLSAVDHADLEFYFVETQSVSRHVAKFHLLFG